MALIPQIVDAVDIPVLAAGSIVDGRGLAAALAFGLGGRRVAGEQLARWREESQKAKGDQ